MNHKMWPISQVVNRDEKMSFDEAVGSMINAWQSKFEWMDDQIRRF